MHDEMLERRLQAALHGEADAMTMTITSAELERRFALRRRRGVSRMVTLLAAAGIGVGIVGAAGAAAGWFDRATLPPGPAPSTAPAIVGKASPPPSPSLRPSAAPPTLPTLDALIAAGDPSTVVLAQAHGPADGPAALPASISVDPPRVQLALPPGHADYEVVVRLHQQRADGCLRHGPGALWRAPEARHPVRRIRDLEDVQGPGHPPVPHGGCGAGQLACRRPPPLGAARPDRRRGRTTRRPWAAGVPADHRPRRRRRLAIRRPRRPDAPVTPVQVASLPPRRGFTSGLSCSGAPSMRFVLTGDGRGPSSATRRRKTSATGSSIRHRLTIAQPFGTNVFVAPIARRELAARRFIGRCRRSSWWSVEPGWQLSSGLGPNLEFLEVEERDVSLSAGDKPGPVRVVFTCAGSGIGEGHLDAAARPASRTSHSMSTVPPGARRSSGRSICPRATSS